MNLKEVKTLIVGTIKQSFTNKKTLDKFDDSTGILKYDNVPVNNVPYLVADDAPVGNIIAFMGNSAPQDYLACNGAIYNIADYPLLSQHIKAEFGSYNYFGGDGSTTFAVPDLRGEFLRGTGAATRNSGSGANVGEHQDATQHFNVHFNQGKFLTYPITYGDTTYQTVVNQDKTISVEHDTNSVPYIETISGDDYDFEAFYTSRPTNTSVLYCIKYQITQNNISKDMVNYSLEEQVIGSWIDGKPLYQKTIKSTTDVSEDTTKVILVDETIDIVCSITGMVCNSGNVFVPICFSQNLLNVNNCINITAWYRQASHELVISINHADYQGKFAYITIQYTKTTDAENSFTQDMLSNISTLNTTASDEEVNEVIGGI